MLKSFIILDLPIDASDAQIRERYLKLVKEFTPEKAPDKFQNFTTAYEGIKDRRSRVKSKIFNALRDMEGDATFRSLVKSVKFKKKHTNLGELLQALN